MRRKLHTLWVFLMFVMAVMSLGRSGTVQAATAAYGTTANPIQDNGSTFTGVKALDGVRYYVKKGVIVKKKGFVTYKSRRYYVKDTYGRIYTEPGYLKVGSKNYVVKNTKGWIATGEIRKDAKYGYYWVDKNGVIDKRRVIKYAIKFVRKHSNKSDSKAKRLRDCYAALCRYPYSSMNTQAPTAAQLPDYALYMFKNHRGNCYRYASAMAYIAKVLGYSVRVGAGGVTARGPYASLSRHGWCEVKMSGTWCVFDCSMQRVNRSISLGGVPFAKYPYRIRKDKNIKVR